MLAVVCPHCGGNVEIAQPSLSGQAQCPHCSQPVAVPPTPAPKDTNQETLALDTQPGTAQGATNPANEAHDFLAPPQEPGELGRLGPYRVLKVLGTGGMGIVFLAEDLQLQRSVALKCLLPTLAATALARQRFLREARSAAAIEHEHIVVIYQVGEDRGVPYLAMQFLQGESLEDRLAREGKLPVAEVLRLGREIAEGLAAAHARGLIHRDVKPGNIWLEGPQARVKLLDFGLARAVAENTLMTQQGAIVGTPAYMAPEQASGAAVDARSDLFSLGCVLYQMSTGQLPFQGTNTISVLLAVANITPFAPCQVNQELPEVLSDLIVQLLAKDPQQRPASAQAVVEAVAALQQRTLPPAGNSPPMFVAPKVPAAPVTHAGQAPKTKVLEGPAWPPSGPIAPPAEPKKRPRRRRWPLWAAAGAILLLAGAAWLALLNRSSDQRRPDNPGTPAPPNAPAVGPVEFGIAYGTEKKNWLESAVTQFGQTPEGKDVKINLFPRGSREGGQAVWDDEDQRIQVWAPASSLFRDDLVRNWRKKHAGNPILKEETLALTPMVFVFWEDRYQAFLKKYGSVSFTTIGQAMQEEGGWAAIGGQPDWGQFKFSHTDAAKSNSGLMTLVLMACEHRHTTWKLTAADVADPGFQAWLKEFEKGIPNESESTGFLMEDMVRRGPSSYDALFVYESVVGDYLKAAEGRWGKLHVVYPPHNLWSDNPYYILDVPWSSPAQRRAAEAFLHFLMSEPLQRQALAHGFRPGNLNVPVKDVPEGPFVRYPDAGFQVDLKAVAETPDGAAVDDLLSLWGRVRETK